MQAAPARYVSVSELYSTDEVELLLDEIRELEPTSCRGEDVQDFEIAGSGAGGRSPAGTEGTERSWDSHAQYLREPPRAPQPLAPLYCRPRYLITPQGFATLIIVLCSACVCGCVWGAAGVRLGGGGAGAGAARALQLGALSSLLLHAALLAMRLSALHSVMPIDWDALSALCCLWTAGWQLGGAALLLRAVLLHHAHAPHQTRDLFFAAIGLAGVASVAAAGVAAVWARARFVSARELRAPRGAYSAVPAAPAAPAASAASAASAAPSTSRHAPL